MSERVRSLLSLLSRPFQGRGVRGRIAVPVLLLVGAAAALVAVFWPEAKAQTTLDAEGSAYVDYGFASQEEALAYIRQLRTEAQDYARAKAAALAFLDYFHEADVMRQLVHYEYASALRAEGDVGLTLQAFEDIIALYADLEMGSADEDNKIDDAHFFRAVSEERLGDTDAAIGDLRTVIDTFPGSNREVASLMRLGGIYDRSGDRDTAMNFFATVVANHPTDPRAPEAAMQSANMEMSRGHYRLAHSAFRDAVDRWPGSQYTQTARRYALRALVHEELEDWDVSSKQEPTRTIDNWESVRSELQEFEEVWDTPQELVGVWHDMINYHRKRSWWINGAAVIAAEEVPVLAQKIIETAPDSVEAQWAKIDLAKQMHRSDPDAALELMELVIADAVSRNHEALLCDAMYEKATLLSVTKRYSEACDTCLAILGREIGPQFRGEVRIKLAMALVSAGDIEGALATCAETAFDETYPDDVRSCALMASAQAWMHLREYENAVRDLDILLAEFSATPSAPSAAALRDYVVTKLMVNGN